MPRSIDAFSRSTQGGIGASEYTGCNRRHGRRRSGGHPRGTDAHGSPLPELLPHLVDGERSLVALLVPAHRGLVVLDLAVAHDQHVRDLAQLRLADLAADRLRAVVDLYAE